MTDTALKHALEPFALISSEGVVTQKEGHVTITTCAEYFHRAAAALFAHPHPVETVQADVRQMLESFGAFDIREGSRCVLGDGTQEDEWEDYLEVPTDVLARIQATVAALEARIVSLDEVLTETAKRCTEMTLERDRAKASLAEMQRERAAQPVEDGITDEMLNAGQERLCQIASRTHFDDHIQAEIYKAMRAVDPAFKGAIMTDIKHIQALHAAISRRSWHDVEFSANAIRDNLTACQREKEGLREAAAGATLIIEQIEQRFPNWQSYRDLVDCIDCTLNELRTL